MENSKIIILKNNRGHDKWSFTKGSNKALTGQILVFYVSGRLLEIVTR